jgi:ABC-type transport system involved in cytochrome bd biosynthesis fused ATPase/permease subunit
VQRLGAASRRLSALAARDALASAAATTFGSLLSGLAIVAVLVVAVPAVRNGTLNAVLLAALVFLVLGAFEGITPLPAAARRLRACAEAARRLDDLRATAPPVTDPLRARPLPGDPSAQLALRRVDFRYGDDEPWLLRGAALRLQPGTRTALVGPSGAGKTTIAHLLVRFLDPVAGTVEFGGVDVRELAQDDLRRAVVLAAQDAHVFTTTIRENLALARRSATEAELWAALDTVCLADWVRSLPDGLDTVLGEDGELVSGGQRRRIALARALLADARYLILDEPTAHLDADTAGEMLRRIDAAVGQRGLLVITHRREGVELFERRLELDGGRITVLEQFPDLPGDLQVLTSANH